MSGAVSLRLVKFHRVGGADGSRPPPLPSCEGRRLGFEMKVGKMSDPMSIAGAIANRVRKGQRVHLTCVGHESVSNCVHALGTARSYLRRDAIDVAFKPEMYNTTMPHMYWYNDAHDHAGAQSRGVQATAMYFDVLAQQV